MACDSDADRRPLKTPAYRYEARLLRAVDGDTGLFCIDLGFDCSINLKLRIADVNTPERGEKGYSKAKDFLASFKDKDLIVETHKLTTGKDARSFERYVADCWCEGKSLAQSIIDAGCGVRVDG